MNDIKLQEGHPVDENLRPLKVGGISTALETAQHGNGARVTGNLEVTGNLRDIRVNSMASAVEGSIITMESTSIILQAGGNVIIRENSSDAYLNINPSSNYYSLHNSSDTGDLFAILVDTHGATTLSTVDDDAAAGDLTLDIDGDITLDSYNGNFLFYDAGDNDDYFKISVVGGTGATRLRTISAGNDGTLQVEANGSLVFDSTTGAFKLAVNGTEFSVASSSYAGTILGYRMIGEDATNGSYTFTTSLTVPDSDMTVRFIAPPSGAVEVTVQFFIDGSSGRYNYIGLSDNATFNSIGASYEQNFNVTDESDAGTIQHSWVVTGLTAGDTYNYWIGVSSSSTVGYIKWGGTAGGRQSDFIMKVIALPTAVSDFAVYD